MELKVEITTRIGGREITQRASLEFADGSGIKLSSLTDIVLELIAALEKGRPEQDTASSYLATCMKSGSAP